MRMQELFALLEHVRTLRSRSTGRRVQPAGRIRASGPLGVRRKWRHRSRCQAKRPKRIAQIVGNVVKELGGTSEILRCADTQRWTVAAIGGPVGFRAERQLEEGA